MKFPPPIFDMLVARAAFCQQLHPLAAFPVAPVHLGQRWNGVRVTIGHNLGGFNGALQGAGAEMCGSPVFRQAQVCQLGTRVCIEWYVAAALDLTGAIPMGVAMADQA